MFAVVSAFAAGEFDARRHPYGWIGGYVPDAAWVARGNCGRGSLPATFAGGPEAYLDWNFRRLPPTRRRIRFENAKSRSCGRRYLAQTAEVPAEKWLRDPADLV